MTGLFRIATIVLCLCAGCAQRGDVELLESHLRQQERTIQELQAQLQQRDQDLTVAKREVEQLDRQLANGGAIPLEPERRARLAAAEKLAINPLMTGGLDTDGEPGDDVLVVHMLPTDGDGDAVKLPGRITIELLDLSQSGDGRQVGTWTLTEAEAAEVWQRGLTGSGYVLKLPLRSRPITGDATLHASFTAPDGREFRATKQVRIDSGTTTDFDAIAKSSPNRSGKQIPNTDVPPPPAPPVLPFPKDTEAVPVSLDEAAPFPTGDPLSSGTLIDVPPPPDEVGIEPAPASAPQPLPTNSAPTVPDFDIDGPREPATPPKLSPLPEPAPPLPKSHIRPVSATMPENASRSESVTSDDWEIEIIPAGG